MSKNLVYVEWSKTLRCGCNPGYASQGSLIPFRHKHVLVAFREDSNPLKSSPTVPAPDNARVWGSWAARWWTFLDKHRLTAYPKGLSRRERRALEA